MSQRKYYLGININVENYNTDDKYQDEFEEQSQVYNIIKERSGNFTMIGNEKLKFDTLFTFDKNKDDKYELVTITDILS